MKKRYFAIPVFVGVFALIGFASTGFCSNTNSSMGDSSHTCYNNPKVIKLVKGLKELSTVPAGTEIETCDLSNQGFFELPNLTIYKIKKLNISGNQLWYWRGEHYIYNLFPKNMEELNMSNCKLVKIAINKKGKKYITKEQTSFWLLKERFPNLKVINVSNTNIYVLKISFTVERLEAVNCGLYNLYIDGMSKDTLHLKYLDISKNWNMYSGIGVEPERIDTLKCDSTAKGERIWPGIWCHPTPP